MEAMAISNGWILELREVRRGGSALISTSTANVRWLGRVGRA